jgi:hypothetical protein
MASRCAALAKIQAHRREGLLTTSCCTLSSDSQRRWGPNNTAIPANQPIMSTRIERPAGTIPVLANPVGLQAVRRLHIQGGSTHQGSVQRGMPPGAGYCPTGGNAASTKIIMLSGTPHFTGCTPCAAGANITVYDHDLGNGSHGGNNVLACM